MKFTVNMLLLAMLLGCGSVEKSTSRLLASGAFGASGEPPKSLTPVRIDAPIADPYQPGKLHAVPGNFRGIGQYYFGQQPVVGPGGPQKFDPYQNQWLTMKYFFGIRTDIDLRPANESSSDANENASSNGYLKELQQWWVSPQFQDPEHRYPFADNRIFQFHQGSVAVPDNTPLDDGGINGPWNFQRAEHLLDLVTTPGACPVFVHCHAGEGRTGIAAALIAYAVFGLPMDQAIRAARHADGSGGPGAVQVKFLQAFAAKYPDPGYLWTRTPEECVKLGVSPGG